MHSHIRKYILLVAGITEAVCGAIEFFGQHKAYGLAFIGLGIMFALLGMVKDKAS